MRSAPRHRQHHWPLLLAAGVVTLCASTALASRRSPAGDLRAALTTSPAAAPATLPAVTFAVQFDAGFAARLAADLAPSPFRPLTDHQGTVHAVADGDGVIAESYLVRPDGTVQIYGSDRTPPRLVLARVRPLDAGQPQSLQLVFSEDVQATGATAVALTGPGGQPHPLTLDPAAGRVWRATLDPTLVPGDAFTLTVTGVEDLAGNAILPQSLSFVVPEPAAGLVLPGTADADVLAVLDGPTGLALVLGTAVDPAAIPAGLVSVKRAGLAVAGSVSVHTGGDQPLEGAVLMWTPADPQAYQPGACEVSVAAGLVDLAGHPIHGPPDAIAYDHTGQGDVVWSRPEDAPILSASQVGNDRFLHGRPLIATLGLYDHRARFYDPTTQTFLEEAPLGPVDSPNLYQAFGLDPQNNTDPYGLCKWNDWECWGWVAKDFGVKTGYDLWNVASLGTLERVEQQSNLGTWEGVRESMTIAKDRIGNAGTLGAQDNLVAALESTGDLSGVPMAISKTAYDLTPMEEARVLIQEGDQLSTEQKIQLGLTGVSKTASLGAVAVGGGRIYSAYQEAGSVRALLSVRRAQLTRGGIKKVGDAGEAALREIVPDAQPQVKADIRIGGRGRRFDGQRLTPANQRIAYEVKNGPINRVPAQARWDAQALSGEYLVGSDWYLLRGGSPGALQTMRGMGLNLHNLGPVAPAWQVYHPGFTLFPAMQNTIGGTP